MIDPQTSSYPYLLPPRYRVAPCVGAAIGGLLGTLFFWFVAMPMLARPGMNDVNVATAVLVAGLMAILIFAVVCIPVTGICMFLIASSDLAFSTIQACQSRGFCSRIAVARRYVFGASTGSYLGCLMLWSNCISYTCYKLPIDWAHLSDSLFRTAAYQTLYSKTLFGAMSVVNYF